MRSLLLFVTGLSVAVFVGCMMRVGSPSRDSAPDQELTFGPVPIIRTGMEKDQVETMLQEQGIGTYIDASNSMPPVFSYPEAGLRIVYVDDKVESCGSTTTVVSGPFQRDSISDSALKQALRPGLPPKEVAQKLGAPTCGFENAAGRVVLIYPRGVEATFVDYTLSQWRRTTYRADGAK